MPIIIAILVILLVIFTWPFWVGLLLIAGPMIPAAIIVFVLALVVMFANECWKDWQRGKAISNTACKKCGAAPGEPCVGMDALTKKALGYHALRLQAAGIISKYYNLD